MKREDFVDNNFTFDMITLLTKNINPFSLERKIVDVKNREIIYMLWDGCIEKTFYKHICENNNFIYLSSKKISNFIYLNSKKYKQRPEGYCSIA